MKVAILTWTIAILLIILDIYLVFADPLGREFGMHKVTLTWLIIVQIGDYSLRNKKTYNTIRNIAIPVLLAIFYFLFPL